MCTLVVSGSVSPPNDKAFRHPAVPDSTHVPLLASCRGGRARMKIIRLQIQERGSLRRVDVGLSRWREVSLRKRAAGAGLEVTLEVGSCRFVREFDRHDYTPGSMSKGIPGGSGVMPIKPLIHVCCTTDVVSRRVGFAPQNENESRSDSTHATVFARLMQEVGRPTSPAARASSRQPPPETELASRYVGREAADRRRAEAGWVSGTEFATG